MVYAPFCCPPCFAFTASLLHVHYVRYNWCNVSVPFLGTRNQLVILFYLLVFLCTKENFLNLRIPRFFILFLFCIALLLFFFSFLSPVYFLNEVYTCLWSQVGLGKVSILLKDQFYYRRIKKALDQSIEIDNFDTYDRPFVFRHQNL